MGMFGRQKAQYMAAADTGKLTLRDRAAIFAAAMNRDYAGAMQLRQMPQMRAQQAAAQQANESITQLFTPKARVSEGTMGPDVDGDPMGASIPQGQRQAILPQINDPAVMQALVRASQVPGAKVDAALDLLKANQPDVRFDRGYGYNGKTGAPTGGFHADVGEGRIAQLGPDGQPTGVRNLPGYAEAIGDVERAKADASESTKAGYDLVDVPTPDGGTVKMPRLMAGQLLSRSAVQNGVPAGLGRSQTPAEARAAAVEAEAGANARVSEPSQLASAQQAVAMIDELTRDPGLKDRTGMKGVLPAIPGTHGVAIDAMHKQLTGKVFLQAYGELKGSGAITELEGQKAQDAIARLNRSQSYKDYTDALQDLRAVVTGGMERVRQKSAMGPSSARPRANLSAIPVTDRMAEARRRGLIP